MTGTLVNLVPDVTVSPNESTINKTSLSGMDSEDTPSTTQSNVSNTKPTYGIGGIGADPDDCHDLIPGRFIRGVAPDRVEARRRWQVTKRWRYDEGIDRILEEPQPHWAFIKSRYQHFFHKKARTGQYVYTERPGVSKLSSCFKSGLTLDDLVRHYVFITEFMWRIIEPNDDAQLISIYDLRDSALADIAGPTLSLFKKCSEVIGAHYPERSYKMIVINAPWYFTAGFNIVSPFIDPNTRKKIEVHGRDYRNKLLEYLDEDSTPPEYGGTDTDRLGESPVERALLEHVQRVNSAAGIPTDKDWLPEEVVKRQEKKQ